MRCRATIRAIQNALAERNGSGSAISERDEIAAARLRRLLVLHGKPPNRPGRSFAFFRDAVCALLAARPACSVSTIDPDKLYALDKRRGRATLSRLRGINAKADPGDTRCPTLVEVSFERSVEVE